MAVDDRFDRVLAGLYQAALGDVDWVSAGALINDMIRTTGHGLSYVDQSGAGEPQIVLNGFFQGGERREDMERLYFRDYYWRDEAIPRLRGLRDGELAYRSELYTDQEKKTSPAYNEFRRRARSQDGLFMVLYGLDGCGTVWSLGNSTERDGWGQDHIHAINGLAPHLHHFARVRCAMADARALGASLSELLENRRSGIIQLDRHARIREANDRARDILLKRDGLRDEDGMLAAENSDEDVKLQRLLSQALPPYGLQGAGDSMKITHRKSQAPLVLEVHPVGMMSTDHHTRKVAAFVIVVDPAARPRVAPDLAAAALGLTPAEGRVAVALATGQTVAGIADALGCAESTVRMHLKRVYRKQGIHKQTELVQRVLSLEGLRGGSFC